MAGAGSAAVTAGLALTPAALPAAQAAIDINWNPAYTAGTLAGLIDRLGNAFPGTDLGFYNTGPPAKVTIGIDDIPIVGAINLSLTLDNIAGDTPNLYNTVGSIPLPNCAGIFASNCRYAVQVATGATGVNLVDSYRTQIASVVDGVTPAGYIPFAAAPNSTGIRPTQTNQGLLLVNNPLRPNGGVLARFPGLSGLVGIDTVIPAPGYNTSSDERIRLNTATLDLTWAYDPLADFPEVLNPFSLLNSLFAALPINLVGGIELKGDDLINAGLNLAAVLQFPGVPLIGTLPMEAGKSWYLTLAPNQLPILAPLRLPSLAVNAVLGALGSPFLLGTPLSDALEPALKILVNIGYDDVVTPTEGGTYDRTFTTSGTATPFGSVNPLTPAEWAQVPGDVFRALVDGVTEQLQKPFFGILVPADGGGAAATAARTPAPVSSVSAVRPAQLPAAFDAVPLPVAETDGGAAVVLPDSDLAELAPTPALEDAAAGAAPAAVGSPSVRGPSGPPAARADRGSRQAVVGRDARGGSRTDAAARARSAGRP